tara:strand:- start:2045 stop:4354 length:2310 start_codon:yes stop_codon:yes gene_type:complete
MVGQDTSIDVVLRLQDLATKELKQFAAQTKKGGKTAEKSFKGVQREVKKTGVSLKKLAAGAVGFYAAFRVAKATIGAGLGFVDAASEAEESLSKFTVVFGKEAKRVEGAIDGMAAAAGRSRFDLIRFTGGLQDTFVPLGFARDQAADLSLAMTQLAVDVASFSNRADEDVIRDFTSAITGSSETVKKYGIIINEVKIKQEALNLGLVKQGETMDDVAKTMARASLIFKGTSDAQGDAARTSTSWANTMKSLSAQIDRIRVEVGSFVRDELLLLINSFGTAEEIGKKLTNAFAAVGVATVGVARLLAAVGRAAFDMLEDFGGLGGVVEAIGQFGITVATTFEKLAATIPLAVALMARQFLRLKKDVQELKLTFFEFANSIADIPIFGSGEQISTAGTRKKIHKLANEISASSRDVAKESLKLAAALVVIATEEEAARARMTEFTESLNASSEGVEGLNERIGRLLTTKDGLLGFFDGLKARVTASKNEVKGLTGAMGGLAKFGAQAGLAAGTAGLQAQAFNDSALPGAVEDRDRQDETDAQTAALREQADAAKAVWEETERQSSAWMGAQEAVDQYAASLSDFALTKDLVGGLFQTLESGLGQFSRDLVEGEANFKEFAQNTIKQIGAMIIQFLLLKAVRGALGIGESGAATGGGLLGALGFADGGVMQGSMSTPVHAYANGGVASSPQVAVFGEGRGAEAFVPLPDGKKIPVDLGGGGGGGANVTIQISAIDSQSGMEFLDKHAKMIGDNVANAIEAGANRKLIKAVGR